jgi:hypothetical protein
MQTTRILQAVILMSIVALAASCGSSKEYTSKIFASRIPIAKDSQVVALRFLELDNLEKDSENLVTTDIIMGRDTTTNTIALDNLAKTLPAKTDRISKSNQSKSAPVITAIKPVVQDSAVVVKTSNPGEVRTKKTRE